MPKILPRVFVGSSSEAEVYAWAFCNLLKDSAEMVPWRKAKEFKPGANILKAISEAAFNYDFGIFVFAPDDVTVSRGEKSHSTRDNVLFEFGLFLGELGSDRAIGVMQESKSAAKKVKVPSDLHGIIMPKFSYPLKGNSKDVALQEAEQLVQDAASEIREAIEEHGPKTDMELLSSYGSRIVSLLGVDETR